MIPILSIKHLKDGRLTAEEHGKVEPSGTKSVNSFDFIGNVPNAFVEVEKMWKNGIKSCSFFVCIFQVASYLHVKIVILTVII